MLGIVAVILDRGICGVLDSFSSFCFRAGEGLPAVFENFSGVFLGVVCACCWNVWALWLIEGDTVILLEERMPPNSCSLLNYCSYDFALNGLKFLLDLKSSYD